jgi:intracellular septation protein A
MTVIHDTDLAAIPVLPRPALPQLKAVIARVAASLATAVVAPAILFAVTLVIINVYAAVSVALAWMVAAMCWRWATRRPVSGLLVLTLAIMTMKTGFTLATGNTFVYFVQPVFADAAAAAIFLGSLWTARPIVARIAPDFYPVDAALAARPRIRLLFRRLTLLWGLVLVVKGSVTMWLLVTLSTVNFVLIKSSAILTLTLLATTTTIALSAIVGRQEGLLRPAGHPG